MWPRRRHQLALLLLFSCYCCLIAPVACRSRDKDGRRRSDRLSAASSTSASASSSSYYSSSSASASSSSGSNYASAGGYVGPIDTTGFCTRRRDMKLMCYCTPDENHVPVQKAECWVFADGLLQNDTTWTRFFQQKRLRDLKFVIQNHGRLDYIPTMVLEPLKNLSSITLEYSQVEVVKSNAFANLPYLDRIILTNNQIMALDQDAFANHIRLRELNLEHNQIYEIDRYAFRNLPQCERLFLNNNNISNLHDSLFAEMARLVYLNLAHNQISVLTSEIFKGLGNLNVLKLSHNNVNFIGDTVFAELWSLVELELDDNRIERISERALDGLNNLKTLNLRNNMLKKIDNGLLRGTPALLSINVQSNDLETLTFYTFQPIMDNLVNSTSELLLSDNNFVCDCRLQWIFELKNRTRYQQLRDALEEFVCTLQEPKISNFVEPVPNHILDLLNIGAGYSGSTNNLNSAELHSSVTGSLGGGGGRKRLSKAGRLGVGQRGGQRLEKTTQMQIAERATALRKRSLVAKQFNAGADSHSPEALNNAYAEKPYYDEAAHGMLAHKVELEDGLDVLKQNALYNQHNDVLIGGNTITEHTVTKQPLGIKVRLFTLKPENLPCHDELSDPTELPLSRDLMDVRSNVQINAASAAVRRLPRRLCAGTVTALIMALAFAMGGRMRRELQVG